MDEKKFEQICSRVPRATPTVGKPSPTWPYHCYPATPLQTLSDGISREYHSNVNKKLSWLSHTEVKPSDFAAHNFLQERSISGTNYFKHSNLTYNYKLHQGWSDRYFAILERETWRRNRTNYNLSHNYYRHLTSCSHKWKTPFMDNPNLYKYHSKLRNQTRKKQKVSEEVLVNEDLKQDVPSTVCNNGRINRNYICNSNLCHIIERTNRNYCIICARGLSVGGIHDCMCQNFYIS